MEIIITVLITLGVCVIVYALMSIRKMDKRVNDLEVVRMELIDLDYKFERIIDKETDQRIRFEGSISRRYINLEDDIKRKIDSIESDIDKLKGEQGLEKNY